MDSLSVHQKNGYFLFVCLFVSCKRQTISKVELWDVLKEACRTIPEYYLTKLQESFCKNLCIYAPYCIHMHVCTSLNKSLHIFLIFPDKYKDVRHKTIAQYKMMIYCSCIIWIIPELLNSFFFLRLEKPFLIAPKINLSRKNSDLILI